jgi:uncharacterized protein (PEP-CTERM system associated)
MDTGMDTGMKSSELDRFRAVGIPLVGLLVLATGASAYGQEERAVAPAKLPLRVVPHVSVSETWTNNVGLDSVGQRSELITEISPGILINIDNSVVKSHIDFSLSTVHYAKNSSPNRTRLFNALTAFGTLKAVDDWAFVDFSGSISQHSVSAFGTQSIDNTSINANRAEVSTYRVSPYVRGALGSFANYEARYSRTISGSDSVARSDVTTDDVNLTVSGSSSFSKLGWTASASKNKIDYSRGRATEAERLNLGLSYSITPQLNFSVYGGQESNNYTSLNKQSFGTSGVGMNWSPSQTTKFSATRDKQSFGSSHSVSFEHRTARTAWRFSDSKGVSATPGQTEIVSLGSVYDLLFSLFASLEPDPIARARLVDSYLQSNGIDPDAIVTSSFLTSALALQRSQNLSFSLLGLRDTIIFVASRTQSSRLDTLSSAVDDFNSSGLIRRRAFSVNYSHRLTPNYSLGVLASQQTTSGLAIGQDTTLRAINVNVTAKVGKKSSATVGARRVISNSSAKSYTETAVTGNLNVQF